MKIFTVIKYKKPCFRSNSTNFPSIVDPITNETIVCNQTNSDIRLFNGGNLTAATTLANLTTTTTLAISPLVAGTNGTNDINDTDDDGNTTRPLAFKNSICLFKNNHAVTLSSLIYCCVRILELRLKLSFGPL